MGTLFLVLAIVAALIAVVELVKSKGQMPIAWAVLALAAIHILSAIN